MVPPSYYDFFGGCATVAGALIGLLFVAISVSPEKLTGDNASIDHQVKAGAAFSALVNTLVIALVALLPGAKLGEAAVVLAAAGLATTVSLIILLYREHKARMRPRQIALPVVLLVLYGLELANGMQLRVTHPDQDHLGNQGVLAIIFFIFAIARAWQLVGARDTSLLSTVAEVTHDAVHRGTRPAPGDHAATGTPAGEHADTGAEREKLRPET